MNRRPLHLANALAAALIAAAASAARVLPAAGQGAPPWPQISLREVASNFNSPLGITHAGDGSGRVFVVEQAGRVKIVKNGIPLPDPFLDISSRVSSGGERGLLGLAFPRDYAATGRFYVNYTALAAPVGHTVVARYRASPDPDIADAASEEILLTVDQPFANHNGGQLAFGPRDDFLYIGLGDGGGAGDPLGNAQNLGSLLGKILRIDVGSGVSPYAIPPGNPGAGMAGVRPEIWAWGLRNPWRFSFDRATGDLFTGDVGQGAWEEIDFQPFSSTGGENYGWNFLEGTHCFPAPPCEAPPRFVPPILEYSHASGDESVTGGCVYRGARFPTMGGVYFFADFISGRFGGLQRQGAGWAAALLLESGVNVSSFGEDEAGNLFAAGYSDGIIYEVTASEPAPDVKLNGVDGPLSVSPADTVRVTVSLDPARSAGAPADWWASAATPFGTLWFNGVSWGARQTPAHQGPLFALPSFSIADVAGLSPGSYTVTFGVDLNADGTLDAPFLSDEARLLAQ